MKIELPAPAKINLTLHVTGRRKDGYHNLVTRMQKLDCCDWLELELTDTGQVEIFCDSDEVGDDQSNYAVRAAHLFFQSCGNSRRHGLKIRLVKQIPVAAGLGGGSSDGASVLKGLNELYGFPFSEAELIDCGRSLGADFAFFLSGHVAAVARGIGDILEKADSVDQYHYLLINPGVQVNTRWVYGNYSLTKKTEKFIFRGSLKTVEQGFTPAALHNDLEPVTIARYPVIERIKNMLMEDGAAGALMSGSGPTVFGLFDDERSAEAAVISLTRKFADKAEYRIITAKALGGA
ncbi:MAG: 4-(cytidine 5'-diphospho)-2-C-methyl-D-erythritol kinase [Desulfofustis sp.]|nr:4-(cytidine 5'-diphospho)-2-C-methyl-D-erythritol kinase [Desulfofustis sp.]